MLKMTDKQKTQVLDFLYILMFTIVMVLASGLGTELMKTLPNTFLVRAYCMAPMLIATYLFAAYVRHLGTIKMLDIENRRIDGMMDLISRMIDQSGKMADEIAETHAQHSDLVNEVRKNHAALAAAIDELRWAVRNEDNQ